MPSTGLSPGLHKDIVYSQGSGLKLDAYIPAVQAAAIGPVPAVIIAHGGGWEAGDKVTYVTPLFEPFGAEMNEAELELMRSTPGYQLG